LITWLTGYYKQSDQAWRRP